MKLNLTLFIACFVLICFNSCTKTDTKGFEILKDTPIPPKITGVSSIQGNCVAPYNMSFFADVIDTISAETYHWNINNSGWEVTGSPTYIFTEAGTYPLSLIVENEIANDTFVMDFEVGDISVSSAFSYDALYNNFHAPAKLFFYNETQGASEHIWEFGNGSLSNSSDPDFIYTNSGVYTVKLTSTCSDGSEDFSTASINILPPPTQIYVDKIILDMDNQFDGMDIVLEFYVEGQYMGRSKREPSANFPEKFTFPEDWYAGFPGFQNLTYNGFEDMEIVVVNDFDGSAVFTFEVSSYWYQQQHYPELVILNAGFNESIDIYFSN